MQQLFRTVATLFMGAVMAAGGYVAALVVPQLQAAGGDRLPSPAALFEASPSSPTTGEAEAANSLSLPDSAADWFGSFASDEVSSDGTSPSVLDAAADSLGQIAPASEATTPSPFSKFAAALTPDTADEPTESFGTVQPKGSIDDAFASAVVSTLDQPVALIRTAAETTLTSQSSSVDSFGDRPAAASDASDWTTALQRLAELNLANYRLTPTADGQMRCDVWVTEVTGQSVRRVYSGIGKTPAASVNAAVDRVLARTQR